MEHGTHVERENYDYGKRVNASLRSMMMDDAVSRLDIFHIFLSHYHHTQASNKQFSENFLKKHFSFNPVPVFSIIYPAVAIGCISI